MTIIDRYLFRIFVRVTLILFFSLTGLLIVVDLFTNLDEFLRKGREQGGVLRVLTDYYGARIFLLFEYMGGMLSMAGSMFAVTWLQRSNEMTALSAAGVPYHRVLAPVIIGAMMISALGIANREFGLPAVRGKLARPITDLTGDKPVTFSPKYDPQSDILIRGNSLLAKDRRIVTPNFRLPPECGAWGKELVADSAVFQSANPDRPSGYLLQGVHQPTDLAELKSVTLGEQPVVLAPLEHPWLKPGECFIVSRLSFEELYVGTGWRHYLSTLELIAGLRSRALDNSNDIKIMLHGRFLQPLQDLMVLFLGLPLVLRRDARYLFVTAGMCFSITFSFQLVSLIFRALGNNYLISPTFAAWGPLLAFGPFAYANARPLWD